MSDNYSIENLFAIYQLGKMYLEHGYLSAAEKIFSGLMVVDNQQTPSRLAFGIIKLECGQLSQATEFFREELKNEKFASRARLALALSYVAEGEFLRAKAILDQLRSESEHLQLPESLTPLYRALTIRCATSGKIDIQPKIQ